MRASEQRKTRVVLLSQNIVCVLCTFAAFSALSAATNVTYDVDSAQFLPAISAVPLAGRKMSGSENASAQANAASAPALTQPSTSSDVSHSAQSAPPVVTAQQSTITGGEPAVAASAAPASGGASAPAAGPAAQAGADGAASAASASAADVKQEIKRPPAKMPPDLPSVSLPAPNIKYTNVSQFQREAGALQKSIADGTGSQSTHSLNGGCRPRRRYAATCEPFQAR